MMKIVYKCLLAAFPVYLLVSCDVKPEVVSYEEFIIRLEQPARTRMTLQNPLSLYASERLWKWEEGDMPSVIYVKDGKELVVPASSAEIKSEDPSAMKVSAGQIPSGTALKGASFGSVSAYGKSCRGDVDIPSSMVYARATFSSIGNAASLPDMTLKHQCSYFYIVPDTVDGNRMTSVTFIGKGLKGGTDSQTVRLSFKDSQSDEYVPKWIALSNTATDVEISVTAGGETYHMASFADAGKGKCNLYYVRNTSIGVEYK